MNYVYSQVISILTAGVNQIFERKVNFDLRTLLGGNRSIDVPKNRRGSIFRQFDEGHGPRFVVRVECHSLPQVGHHGADSHQLRYPSKQIPGPSVCTFPSLDREIRNFLLSIVNSLNMRSKIYGSCDVLDIYSIHKTYI
jgi:hypothetical protein